MEKHTLHDCFFVLLQLIIQEHFKGIEATYEDFLKEFSVGDRGTYEKAQRKMDKLQSDLERCFWLDEGNDVCVMRATAVADTIEMMRAMERMV